MGQKRTNTDWVTFSDVVQLLKRKRGVWGWYTLLAIFLGGFFALLGRVEFMADGTFQDKNKKNASVDSTLFSLVGFEDASSEAEGMTMMRSRQLLERVIHDLSLQGEIVEKRGLWKKGWRRVRQNFSTEWAYLLRKGVPVLPDHPEELGVQRVEYRGLYPKKFTVRFVSENEFTLFDPSSEVGQGRLGEVFIFDEGEFLLTQQGEKDLTGHTFFLHLRPLSQQAERWRKLLRVQWDENKKQILHLSFSHPDRYIAAAVVNAMMGCYQDYLERNHREQSQRQMGYLRSRRKESREDLEKALIDFADAQKEGISTAGIVNTQEEFRFLTTQLQLYKDRLLANELDTRRMEKAHDQKNFVFFNPYAEESDASDLNDLLKKIRELKQQRDDIQYALIHNHHQDYETKKEKTLARSVEISFLQKKIADCEMLLQEVEHNGILHRELSLVQDNNYLVGFLACVVAREFGRTQR